MATIAGLKAKIRKLKQERKVLKERKDAVEKVRRNMNSSVPGYISVANRKITSCADDIIDAISVPGNETWAEEDVREKIQKSMEEDSYMSEVVFCIQNEIRRCEDRIAEINIEIEILEKQLRELQEEKVEEFIGGIFG